MKRAMGLDITSMVDTFDDSKKMAREIARAIGIEFRRVTYTPT